MLTRVPVKVDLVPFVSICIHLYPFVMFLRFRVQQVLVSPAEETNVFGQIWQVQLPDGPSTLPLQLVRRLGNAARLASHESSNLIKHIQDIERYQIPFGKCFYKLIGSLSRSRKFANFGVFQSSVFQRGTINVR